MPHPEPKRPAPAARPPVLSLVQSLEPSNADVLRAVAALEAKLDQLHAAILPRQTSLMIDQEEIARTMAQLRIARPVTKETPP